MTFRWLRELHELENDDMESSKPSFIAIANFYSHLFFQNQSVIKYLNWTYYFSCKWTELQYPETWF